MIKFHRGIDPNRFSESLVRLQNAEWWQNALEDPDLKIFVRENYVDIYISGQSIYKIDFLKAKNNANTNERYINDAPKSKRVNFDIDTGPLIRKGLAETAPSPTGLEAHDAIKRNARLFAKGEKIDVHALLDNHPDVLDVEITFGKDIVETVLGKATTATQRIDLVTAERVGDQVALVFWEVKRSDNEDLNPRKEKNVINQVVNYKKLVDHARTDIIESYTKVAKNLVALAEASRGKRSVGPAIRAIVDGCPLVVAPDPEVHIAVVDEGNTRLGDLVTKIEAALKRVEALAGTKVVSGRARDMRLER